MKTSAKHFGLAVMP